MVSIYFNVSLTSGELPGQQRKVLAPWTAARAVIIYVQQGLPFPSKMPCDLEVMRVELLMKLEPEVYVF